MLIEQKVPVVRDDQQLRNLLDLFPDFAVVCDQSGKILYANHYVGMLGFEIHEVIGRKIEIFLPESLRALHESHIRSFNENPYMRRMGAKQNIIAQHKDGKIIDVDIMLAPFSLASQPVVLAVVRDISILKEAEKNLSLAYSRLKLKNDELVNLNSQKNHLLGMAAHDLRSPLAAIKGYADLMRDFSSSAEENKEMLTMIIKSCEHMLSLINDTLDVSAIESGELYLEVEKFDATEACQSAIKTEEVAAKRKEINLNFESTRKLYLNADQGKFVQVVQNLVSNAVKYSKTKTTVNIMLTSDSENLVLKVIDQGQGISQQDIEKLFKPFSRGLSKPTGGEKSVGLGLAIVKRIVEAQGGNITVESELQRGSTFTVTFPLNFVCKSGNVLS